ncbi:Uncharacterized protein conserved in bacteria [Yersinia enterocolitica]|nr:Uncharacterized protein conserved in bacteria [Yersinia enterocolitica]
MTLNELLSHHQESLSAYSAITAQLDNPDRVPTDWQEWGSLVSARINGSLYCLAHHQHNLQQLTEDSALLAALHTGVDQALAAQSTEQISHQLIAVTAELTRAPERFSHQHISPLRAMGLGDKQLLGIIFSAASAGWTNRLRHTLGQTV